MAKFKEAYNHWALTIMTASRYQRNVVSIGKYPPRQTKTLTKIAGAFPIRYCPFLELKKAEAQAKKKIWKPALKEFVLSPFSCQNDETLECVRFIWADAGAKCGYGLCSVSIFIIREWCSQSHPVDPLPDELINKHSLYWSTPISKSDLLMAKKTDELFWKVYSFGKKLPELEAGFPDFRLQRSSEEF